uniref:MTOR-associated protein MEAK7 n=1 Tax=Phallusia mammillata TaxID=59560 RepID=A0A6F9DIM1_9ASCI|nr:uncharacterized protein LOC100187118 [Phallusia mammillata]
MGQSHSTKSGGETEDFAMYLTDQEAESLDKMLGTETEESLAGQLSKLQNHVSHTLPSEIVKGIILSLQVRCNNASKTSGQVLKQEICKMIFGYQNDRISFVYDVLSFDNSSVPILTFEKFIIGLIKLLLNHASSHIFGVDDVSCHQFFESAVSYRENIKKNDFLSLIQNSSVLAELISVGTRFLFLGTFKSVTSDMQGSVPCLLPNIELLPHHALASTNTLLDTSHVVYLNSKLPVDLQSKWRFLYSSRLQGESFSKLSTQIANKGPLLILVKDQGGHVFGGFVPTDLSYGSQFQGTPHSFLFTIAPSLNIFTTTGYNDHYVYFNIRQETMPNGFGMGGQHEYFGLWLSSEFGKGHSKAKPTCTTYKSPQLSSSEEFLIDTVEAWGLGEEPQEENMDSDEDGMTSVIDKNPEAVAILQIAGKERVSEGYRESERTTTMPETTELHQPRDPMDY